MPIEPISAGLLAGGTLISALAPLLRKKGKFQEAGTPEERENRRWASSKGRQQIENPYEGFEPIANRAKSLFEQQTVPSIGERLNQASGARRSSPSYQQQSEFARTDLRERLAALQSQYGLQQQGLGQRLFGLGQQQGYYQPETESGASAGLSALGGGIGQFANLYALNNLMNPTQKPSSARNDINGLKAAPISFKPTQQSISRRNIDQDAIEPTYPGEQSVASQARGYNPGLFGGKFNNLRKAPGRTYGGQELSGGYI
jgi:hypothetical protein